MIDSKVLDSLTEHVSAHIPAIPRWEWRQFAARFPAPFRPEPGAAARESSEIYLLSLDSSQNVKIRDGRLEIKELIRRERDLELWRPTLKAAFPVDHDTLLEAFRVWQIAPPPILPVSCSQSALLTIVDAEPDLRIVRLTKRRIRLTGFACAGEWVELGVDGRRWEGISFEDEDPDRLLAFLHQIRITPRLNESYPQALKRFLATSGNAGAATLEMV